MSPPGPERSPVRDLLADAAFVRLWAAGGLTNSMRWVEMLVSGLFAYELTRSAFAVSLVLMSRALPMLTAGALSGALAESLDRKKLLMAGQAATAVGAMVVAALAASGSLALWHLFANGMLGGLVWTNELATRRRMVAEAAGPHRIVQAVAFDTMTGSTTRMVGPLAGGIFYQTFGVTTAYLIASVLYVAAFILVSGVRHEQERRRLVPRRLAAEVAEAARIARRMPVLRLVLGVTIAMNVFGFSYQSILPAFGAIAFAASPAQIGLLAAAEPFGALLSGLALALRRGAPPGGAALALGSAAFLVLLVFAVRAPTLPVAALLLMLGGAGTAAFASLQTGLVIMHAPIEARSRVLGLTTTCIGMGPLGVLAVGALADAFGPQDAITGMAVAGLAALGLVTLLARDRG
ncbi:MFS transporter [Neoroseomonas oryzicola]|uniref:MFS transporter n=1 Tax=Neoroseomonas oryzicola TaxID=535904 RepID=A0A9X9WHE9_9PROT|nr:MFS transporter [Neoroseomonas oryzicola]MBR0659759.1 MFS transporter [Neoroseomonas oryzicola]NKE17189.1 MFS transporter [Neoroseomonas oryzicola]